MAVRGARASASLISRHITFKHNHFHHRTNLRPSSILSVHISPLQQNDDRDVEQTHRRYFHSSVSSERAAAIILSLGALSAASYGVATAVRAYKEFQEQSAKEAAEAKEEAKRNPKTPEEESAKAREASGGKESKGNSGPRENVFESWFGVGVGAKYYEGGFEPTMTRREAALILGVRESSSVSRVKEAHRKLLILNHPDAGGSTYMAGKINEAKELLLKGKRG